MSDQYIPSLYELGGTFNSRHQRPIMTRTALFDAYRDARDNTVQVYYTPDWDNSDTVTGQLLSFDEGAYRTDWMDHGWYTPAHAKIREELNYGFLGANPDSVRMDEDLMGLKQADQTWAYAGGGWNPANWATHVFSGKTWEYVTRDYDRINEIHDRIDPTFNFKTDGWQTGIDEAFGKTNAPLVRRALEQNGFNGETDGVGAKNQRSYIWYIKKELTKIAGQQYTKSRLQTMDFLWKDREQSDGAREMLLSIGSDWETTASIGVTLPFSFIGMGLKALALSPRAAAALNTIRAGITAGRWVKIENIRTRAGLAIKFTDRAGKTAIAMPPQVDKLRKAGFLLKDAQPRNTLGQFARGTRASGAWQPVQASGSNLANLKGIAKTEVLQGMGFVQGATAKALHATGTVLDWMSFIKTNRTIGGLFYQGSGGAIWGGGYGLQHTWHKQEEAIKRADFIYGLDNHDVSYNGGEIALNTLWMGSMGFGLASIMSLAFGGVGRHFIREGRKLRHLPKDQQSLATWWRAFNGKDISDMAPVDGEMVAMLGLERSKITLGHMLDQITGRTGRGKKPSGWGAALLDKYLIESHHRSFTDLADFLTHIYREVGNEWLPEEVIEELVKDFLRTGLRENGGTFATNAQRAARNRASAGPEPIGPRQAKDVLDEPIPTRDYAGLGDVSDSTYDKLNKLRKAIISTRRKAKKELNETGSISKETMQAHANARKALDDFNQPFPKMADEMAPDLRFRDYDFSRTKGGRAVSKIIEARRNLNQRRLQGADKAELDQLTKKVKEAVSDLDKEYPRLDNKTREQVAEAEANADFNRMVGDAPEAVQAREQFIAKLMAGLARSPDGDKAADSNFWNSLFSRNGLGRLTDAIAELGMGNSNVVYSTLSEMRQLARMLDNTHVFMADDLMNWGQNRSVWHAQRHAMRDAGHVISVIQSVERAVGGEANQNLMTVVLRSVVQDIPDDELDDFIVKGFKELSGESDEAVGSPTPGLVASESKATQNLIDAGRMVREQYQWFFGKYLRKGQDTKLFGKIEDGHRYVPMQISDLVDESILRNIGQKAWEVKARSYLDNGYIPAVELEAQGHIVLKYDDVSGNIVGILDIPRDSIFWKASLADNIPAMAEEVWMKINKMTMDDLDQLQAMADKIARDRGLPAAAQREATREALIEEQLFRADSMPVEVIQSRLDRSRSRIEAARSAVKDAAPEEKTEHLTQLANELYILLRQGSEGIAAENEGRIISTQAVREAYEGLDALAKEGVEIKHYLGHRWSKQMMDDVLWERIIQVPIRGDVGPARIVGTLQPEIKVNGEVVQRAAIILDHNARLRKIQTIKTPTDLELAIRDGDLVSHRSPNPLWEEPRPVIGREGDDLIIEGGHKVPASELELELSLEQISLDDMSSIGDVARRSSFDPDPVHTSTDFFVQGEEQIMKILDEIIHTPLTRRQLGISEADLAGSGLTIVDIIELVNTNAFIKNTIYTAWEHKLDIRNVIPILLRNQIKDAKKVNRGAVVRYVDSLVPEKPLAAGKEQIMLANAHRRKLIDDIRAKKEQEFLELNDLPEDLIIVREHIAELREELAGSMSMNDRNQREEWLGNYIKQEEEIKAKWMADEGLELPPQYYPSDDVTVPIPEKMPEYLKRLEELGIASDLSHLENWKAHKIEEILSRVASIKTNMELDNIQAIQRGEKPRHTRDSIYEAVQNEYEGLALWSAREGAVSVADDGRWGTRLREEIDQINAVRDETQPTAAPASDTVYTPLTVRATDEAAPPPSTGKPIEPKDGEVITPDSAAGVVNKHDTTTQSARLKDAEMEKMADSLGISLDEFKRSKRKNVARYEELKRNQEFPTKLKERQEELIQRISEAKKGVIDEEGNVIVPEHIREGWDNLKSEEAFLAAELESLYSGLYIPKNKAAYIKAANNVNDAIKKLEGLGIQEIRDWLVDDLIRINRKYASFTTDDFTTELATITTKRDQLLASQAEIDKKITAAETKLKNMKKKDGPQGQKLSALIEDLKKSKKPTAARLGHITRRFDILDHLVRSFSEEQAILNAAQQANKQVLDAALDEFRLVRQNMKVDPGVAQKMNGINAQIQGVRSKMRRLINEEGIKAEERSLLLELDRLNHIENRFYNTEVLTPEYLSDSYGVFHITHTLDLNLGDAQAGFLRRETADLARKQAQEELTARVAELTAKFRGKVTKSSLLRGKEKGTKEYDQALQLWEAQKDEAMTVGEFLELVQIGSSAGEAAFAKGLTGTEAIWGDLVAQVTRYAQMKNLKAGAKLDEAIAEDVIMDLMMIAINPNKRVYITELFDLSRRKSRGKWEWIGDGQFKKKGKWRTKEENLLARIAVDDEFARLDFAPDHARLLIRNLFVMKRVKKDGKWQWRKRAASEGLPKDDPFASEVSLARFMDIAAKEVLRRARTGKHGSRLVLQSDIPAGSRAPKEIVDEAAELGIGVEYLTDMGDDAFSRGRRAGKILGPMQSLLKREENQWLAEFLRKELLIDGSMPIAEQVTRKRRGAILRILTDHEGYSPHIMREFADKSDAVFPKLMRKNPITNMWEEPEADFVKGKPKPRKNPHNFFVNPKTSEAGRSLINQAALRRYLQTRGFSPSKQVLKADLDFLEETLQLIRQAMDWDVNLKERSLLINGLTPADRRQGFFYHLEEYGEATWAMVADNMHISSMSDKAHTPVVVALRDKMSTRFDLIQQKKVSGSLSANAPTLKGYSTQIRKEITAKAEKIDRLRRKVSTEAKKKLKALAEERDNLRAQDSTNETYVRLREIKDEMLELQINSNAAEIAAIRAEINQLQEFYVAIYNAFLDRLERGGKNPAGDIANRIKQVHKRTTEMGTEIHDIPKRMNRNNFRMARLWDEEAGEVGIAQLQRGSVADSLLLPLEEALLRKRYSQFDHANSLIDQILPADRALPAKPFDTLPKVGVEQDIILFMNMLADTTIISRKQLVEEVFGLDLKTNKPKEGSLGERLVAQAKEINESRVQRAKEFEEFGVHSNESLLLRSAGIQKLLPEDAGKLMSILLKEWKDSGVVVYDKSKKGWRLTPEGRRVAKASEPRVIETAAPVRREDILDISGTAYTTRGEDGLTSRMRYYIASHKKAQRRARDAEDWQAWSYHEDAIRRIEAEAATPAELRAAELMEELMRYEAELFNLRHFKQDIPENIPMEVKTQTLRALVKKGKDRAADLAKRKAAIIAELKDLLGSYDNPQPATHTSRDPGIWLGVTRETDIPTISGRALEEGQLPEIFRGPKGFNPETDINWNYRGRTSTDSIASNVRESLRGNQRGYTEQWRAKYGEGTALQQGMLRWAQHMNGSMTGGRMGDDDLVSGGWHSSGERNLGDRERVFSADELAANPEFMSLFETDIRKLVTNYALGKGVEIRAQEILNKWMQSLDIAVDGAILQNITWQDLFKYMRTRINNLDGMTVSGGTPAFTKKQVDGLKLALTQAEDVYYEMIGKARYSRTSGADEAVQLVNNFTQALFGPGISQAVATVEIPMSILGRSGSLSDIAHGFGQLLKNFGRYNMLNDTALEGTAFITENYSRGGLARYVFINEQEFESKWTDRIRRIWKRMWAGPMDSTAQGTAMKALDKFRSMEGWNNLLQGTAKMGTEVTGLRQVIYAVKDIAVAKAEFAVAQRMNALFKFSEELDVNLMTAMSTAKERATYVKGVARKVGLDQSMALRWLRAGLVADKNGNNVNAILKQLFEWGELNTTTNRLNKRLMHNRYINEDWSGPMGAIERDLFEDTMDRLVNFLEMQAHDFSPEPRGIAGYTKGNKNWFGRMFAFYATYPLAFYMTYMKKNPSEAGALKSLALLLMVSGFEMMHRQLKAIQNGEDPQELADKWANNPWAMLFREGTSAPWLGFGHQHLRDLMIMPTTAKFTGDPVYDARPGLPAPVSVAWGAAGAVQDAVGGNILTRGARSNSKPPNFMDWLMTGGDMQDETGSKIQASKMADVVYDTFMPTKFVGYQLLERQFMDFIQPTREDQGAILAGAWSPILAEMIANGEFAEAAKLWRQIGYDHNNTQYPSVTQPDTKVDPQGRPRIQSKFQIPLVMPEKDKPKLKTGPRPYAEEKLNNASVSWTQDLLDTPQYLEAPLELFN